MLDPKVQWIEPAVPGLWFGGTHHGRESVFREVIEPVQDKIDHSLLKIKWFYAVGDHVVAIGNFHGRAKATGMTLEAPTAHVWTLRNRNAIRLEAFHDILAWESAMGLAFTQPEQEAA